MYRMKPNVIQIPKYHTNDLWTVTDGDEVFVSIFVNDESKLSALLSGLHASIFLWSGCLSSAYNSQLLF